MTDAQSKAFQVLVLAPTGRDADVLVRTLSSADIAASACGTMSELCGLVGEGAGAAIVTGEALIGAVGELASALRRQPEWSDFPLVILASRIGKAGPGWAFFRDVPEAAHTVVLDRPVHGETIVSVVRSALRSRARQYQVRDELAERRRAEAALRESEVRFRVAVANSGFIPSLSDRELRYRWIYNPHPDFDAASVIGKRDDELEEGEGVRRLVVLKQRVLDTGNGAREEVAFVRRDGVRTYDFSIEPLRDASGHLVGVMSAAFDITDRKRAEEALGDSETRYRTLFESMDQGFCVIDVIFDSAGKPIDYRFLQANPAFERHTGLVGAVGMTAREVAPGLEDHWCETYGRVAVTGAAERIENYSAPLGRWFDAYAFRFGRPADRQVAILFNDITERKRAEDTLRHSRDELDQLVRERTVELRQKEQEVRSVIEHAPDVIARFDRKLRCIFVNPAAEAISGMPMATWLGRRPREWPLSAKVAGEAEANLEEVFRTGRQLSSMMEDQLPAGRRVLALKLTPEFDESGQFDTVLMVGRDETERRLIEEARERLQSQLAQSQKMEAVGRLAGGVAHDFNNMLGAIIGHCDLILPDLDREGQFWADIEQIRLAAQRSAALTRQLLAFSRKQVLQPMVLDLNPLVSNMEKMLRRLIVEDIDMEVTLGAGVSAIKADPGQIEQILMNLVVNARDAMPGGGRLTIETAEVHLDDEYAAKHDLVVPGRYVMLAVTDTGCGIDNETMSHLFEPFFTTKGQGKGTGLGLPTVYGIAKQSGGHLSVYSEVGKGSTFKVFFPTEGEAPSVSSASQVKKAMDRGQETILVVEDEVALRMLMKRMLSMLGYNVILATNGREALMKAAKSDVPMHLMITDVIMPEMGGRQLAEELSKTKPGMKVLFMSGYTDDAIVKQGVFDADKAFIQKPFTASAIATKVREVLDGA